MIKTKLITVTVLFCAMIPAPLHAAEDYTYGPDHCEFAVTFPAEPDSIERCEADDTSRCYQLIRYTQSFGVEAVIKFRVICNPVDADIRRKYDEDVSLAVVRAMARNSEARNFETSFRETNIFRLASLIGEASGGKDGGLYIAQLWTGERSVMSLEAELIGAQMREADLVFSDILRSVGPKNSDALGNTPEIIEER